jgi:hypothetical protein
MVMLALARPALAAPAECLVRFAVSGATATRMPCRSFCGDGDPACDADGATNGTCEIAVALCGGPQPCDDTVPPRLRVRGKGNRRAGSRRRRPHRPRPPRAAIPRSCR